MKKKVILLIVCLFMGITNVYATSGQLRKATIKTCPDGLIYGQHGSDNHYHLAKQSGDNYIADGEVLSADPCPEISASVNKIIEVTFNKCVDGDTAVFNYNGETIKVRFLAIDTPETVHPTKEVQKYGKNASEYTCSAITNAKSIKLEYDAGSTELDKYGRTLAWVFVDDVLLQKELVRIGYAEVKYIYGTYKYTEELYTAQDEAKSESLGIWSDTDSTTSETTTDTATDKIGNYLLYAFAIITLIVSLKKTIFKHKK